MNLQLPHRGIYRQWSLIAQLAIFNTSLHRQYARMIMSHDNAQPPTAHPVTTARPLQRPMP